MFYSQVLLSLLAELFPRYYKVIINTWLLLRLFYMLSSAPGSTYFLLKVKPVFYVGFA